MPNRILREGIIDSRSVNSLSEEAEILYRRLFSVADDFGRFYGEPALIRARCFPLQLDRWPTARVARAIAEMSQVLNDEGNPLVLVYDVGPKRFIQITNFGQRERNAKFPGPTARDAVDEIMSANGGQPPPTAANSGGPPQPAAPSGESPPNASVCASVCASASVSAESDVCADVCASASAANEKHTHRPMVVRGLPEPVAQDFQERHEKLYRRHIVPGYKGESLGRYVSIIAAATNPEAVATAIEAAHGVWMAHFRENPDTYRPSLSKWFEDEYHLRAPPRNSGDLSLKAQRVESNLHNLRNMRGTKSSKSV